ncbi:MAG: hypothetical protein ABSB60_12140 [Terracidiphilus sp.]|jgi:hypothetical protein
MKREVAATLAVAAVAFTLLSPQLVSARSLDDSKLSPSDVPSTMAPQERAQLMVPAQGALVRTLDARDMQAGQEFRVILSRTVRLKDGPELPKGTQLIGAIAADPANANDKSKIELRFTQAVLKGGKTLPIIATVVGVYAPVNDDSDGHPVIAGTQEANTWNSKILEVDQIEPETGVELRSSIASENSGTLVSTKHGAIKLPAGTEIALAIALQKNS